MPNQACVFYALLCMSKNSTKDNQMMTLFALTTILQPDLTGGVSSGKLNLLNPIVRTSTKLIESDVPYIFIQRGHAFVVWNPSMLRRLDVYIYKLLANLVLDCLFMALQVFPR